VSESLPKWYYQEQVLNVIIGNNSGNFIVELDEDHIGIKKGVHFSIDFYHLVNYYGYLKWGNTYYLHRDWTIKRLLGDEQYQKLVDARYPTEIVKIEWHKVVHEVLAGFD